MEPSRESISFGKIEESILMSICKSAGLLDEETKDQWEHGHGSQIAAYS